MKKKFSISRIGLRSFLASALTTLISVVILSLILLGQLYFYTVNSQFSGLSNSCSTISYLTLTWMTEPYKIGTDALEALLTSQSKLNRNNIVVADEEGNALLVINSDTVRNDAGVLPASVVHKLSEGKTIRDVGTLDGWFANRVISVALPVTDLAGNVRGAVIVSSSLSAIGIMFTDFANGVIWSMFLAFALSMAIGYFVSQRMAYPLNQISAAAKRISQGDFTVRVNVSGTDEISDLADSFNLMAESMQELEKVRSDFVANVSHELKTPMTTISGFVDGMLDGTIPKEDYDHYLEIVSSESRRLSRLVTKLLLATRMQSGTSDLKKEPMDICSIISSVVVNLEQRIEDRELSVEINYPEDRVFVLGDEDALTQVVANLCDNAIKYNRDGGHFAVTVENRPDIVFVTVFNTGEGIKAEDLPYIFDRFYKADRSRGLDKSSTGLGLYLVQSILKNLNQKITAESEEGKWSRFTFTLEPAHLGQQGLH